jgi:hypothetical protein
MANPFELLEQFRAFKEQAAELLATTDSGWFSRAAAAKMLEFVLNTALEAGPPAQFGADLGVDDQQARVLYARVLRSAILRQREMVTHGR